jgi:hypothetical protein
MKQKVSFLFSLQMIHIYAEKLGSIWIQEEYDFGANASLFY